jgi:hypothetical protein
MKIKTKNLSSALLPDGFGLIPVVIVCLLAPVLQAVTPPPDGGYPGGNTAEGQNALFSLTTGVWNTAIGSQSLYHVTTGNQNTATGYQTLFSDTTGRFNVANGAQALFNNTSGSLNTATGFRALYANTSGTENTCAGFAALVSNTIGSSNTAYGARALHNNTIGSANTAIGNGALYLNTTGYVNLAIGPGALNSNTTGHDNLAIGGALSSNISGSYNTAIGDSALAASTGNDNTAIGNSAGGRQGSGSNNVYIGSGITGDSTDNNACYIASIFGQTSVSGIPVLINSNNKLGTTTSSKRFKENIRAMNNASEGILALKPVTFHYKKEIDAAGTTQFGLVAEDVEKVNPDLVVRDKDGRPYSVRYDQVNAMLLNEFLKEHRKVEQLTKDFESKLAEQQKQIEALTTGLQKLTARLEVNAHGRNVVLSDR